MSAARRAGKASRAALSCTPKVHTALESAGALVGLRNSWWLEVLIVFACRSTVQSTVQRATVQTLLCTLLRLPASMHTTTRTCKNVRTISCVRRSCCSEGSYMYSPFHTRGSTRQWSDSVVRRGSRVAGRGSLRRNSFLHENFSVCVRKERLCLRRALPRCSFSAPLP